MLTTQPGTNLLCTFKGELEKKKIIGGRLITLVSFTFYTLILSREIGFTISTLASVCITEGRVGLLFQVTISYLLLRVKFVVLCLLLTAEGEKKH